MVYLQATDTVTTRSEVQLLPGRKPEIRDLGMPPWASFRCALIQALSLSRLLRKGAGSRDGSRL
jgi:hypothetical protein